MTPRVQVDNHALHQNQDYSAQIPSAELLGTWTPGVTVERSGLNTWRQ